MGLREARRVCGNIRQAVLNKLPAFFVWEAGSQSQRGQRVDSGTFRIADL
jgi:hypothetical protein